MSSVIIPRILGGLGNQLFIFAAARRLALINNADLALDHISGFAYDHKYRRCYQLDHFRIPCRKATQIERLEPFSRARRYLKRRYNQRLPFERRKYLVQEGMDFDQRLLEFKPRGTLYIEGYWQSESYFKDIESTIRKDLQIKPPKDATNLRVADTIRARVAVAVHIRFFDTPEVSGLNNTPADYYVRAIDKMEELVPDAHYFVFSDQPAWVRNILPLTYDRYTLVNHNQGNETAYADLWLMTLCRHFIIANSTFSWWGAWLANSVDKQVIAPGFESRKGVMWWGFAGQIPEHWARL